MRRNRGGEDEASDGLGRERYFFDLAVDDTEDGFAAKGNEDDLPRKELNFAGVGQNVAAAAEDFCGYYLEKHTYIVA